MQIHDFVKCYQYMYITLRGVALTYEKYGQIMRF